MSYGAAERMPIDIDEFERRVRSPAPRPAGDPLAELARLVSTSPTKPEALDAMFARPGAGSDRHAHAPDGASIDLDALRGSFPGEAYAGDLDQAPHPHDTAPHANIHYAEESYEVPHDHREPAAEVAWTPDASERPVPESPAGRSRLPLYATAAVIAVGLLGIGTTFAFKGSRGGSGELVEVKAAPGPTKVQAQAGDTRTAASDSTVLDRNAAQQPVTRVIDRQERPVDLKEATRAAPRNVSTTPIGSSQMANLAGSPTTGGDGSIFSEPRKVKTVSVRPDGTVVGGSTAEAAPSPPPETAFPLTAPTSPRSAGTPKAATRAATTPRPAEKPEAAAKPETPVAEARPVAPKPKKVVAAKPAPAKVARAEEADTDTETAAAAPAVARSSGGFTVQLAAPGNEAEARATASRLGQKYSDAFGGARLQVQKASDKAVYRVRSAGMSRESAVAACEKVKSAGGACFVAKN